MIWRISRVSIKHSYNKHIGFGGFRGFGVFEEFGGFEGFEHFEGFQELNIFPQHKYFEDAY